MNNLVFVNCAAVTDRVHQPLAGGDSTWQRLLAYIADLPEVGEIFVLTRPNLELPDCPGTAICRPDWDEEKLFAAMRQRAADRQGCLFYFYGDCPFLDTDLTNQLYASHRRYWAQYTFADGYPYGLTPEIIDFQILSPLTQLARQKPLSRKTLFEVISRDINSFDIETTIAPRDLRLLRLCLASDSRRNTLLCDRLAGFLAAGNSDVSRILLDHPAILRTLPAYFEVQITNAVSQKVAYLPEYKGQVIGSGKARQMAAADFSRLCAAVHEFAGDGVINLGFRGEPALHSGLPTLLEAVLEFADFRALIETSGLGWSPEKLAAIKKISAGRIDWILTLDTDDPGFYARLRGAGLQEALRFYDQLAVLFPDNIWVQATRLREGEEFLENFYRRWKEKPGQLIIQKHDHFCGQIPACKITDLSPVKRFPCWHNKRDLAILLDGSALLCKEVLTDDNRLGNVFTEPLSEIWRAGEALYASHCRSEFEGICKECDEYYTYNF